MPTSRTHLLACLGLLLATIFWGSSFPAMKTVAEHSSPGLMVCIRWSLAALLLSPFINWRNRALWRAAALLGGLLFAGFVLQVLGLTLMSAGRNAFITGLSVVIVPLLLPLLGKRLSRRSALAAALAGLGITLMSYEQGNNWLGDALTLACALSFAFYILALERFAARHQALALAGAQAVVMSALCPLWLLAEYAHWGTDYPAMLTASAAHWPALLYLGLICSGLALLLQTWAQARVSAVQAAILYALEPFFATLFAVNLLHESFGLRAMSGGALVIGAMIISQWPTPAHRQQTAEK